MKILPITCYMNNISENIVKHQKDVFNLFGMDLIQEYTELNHPDFLDEKIRNSDYDIIIFFDIDCIPLKPNFYEYVIENLSDNNSIIGVEQCSLSRNKDLIYAGAPCFAITKEVYEKLDKPSFKLTHRADTAGEISLIAKEKGVNVKFFNIKTALNQKWKCGDKYFGNGTIYDDWLYHQFEVGRYSKTPEYKILEYQFVKKCKEVIKKYGNK